jgi:hypothetical protein
MNGGCVFVELTRVLAAPIPSGISGDGSVPGSSISKLRNMRRRRSYARVKSFVLLLLLLLIVFLSGQDSASECELV